MYQHGGDIYRNFVKLDFSANLNFLGMPARVAEAARAGVDAADCYPDPSCRALREAISEKEGVPAEEIVCGNGASELIYSYVRAVKPREAVLFAPGFYEYEQALAGVDCRMHFCVLREEEKFAGWERVLPMLTDRVDLLILCVPHNPTGGLPDPSLLAEILQRCRQKKIRVLFDACFLDSVEEPEKTEDVAAAASHPELFVLKAFTKLYAMPGLRLGYALTSEKGLPEKIAKVRQPWSVSVPAQYAGIAALRETEYVKRYRDLLAKERPFLRSSLEREGMKVYGSEANFVFFRGPEGLADALLARGIRIRDCSNYRGLTEGFFRAAVRSREENLVLLQAIREIRPDLPERP